MLKLTFNNYSVNGYFTGLLLRILTIIHLSSLMNQGITWKTTDFFIFFPQKRVLNSIYKKMLSLTSFGITILFFAD
jgi:hypothetical protein